jgi:hypothetical protein
MVEFVLLLPLIILVCGLSMYLAMGLSTKEDLVVHTRYKVWRDAQDTYMMPNWFWRDDLNDGTWSPYDPTANGQAGTGTGNPDANRPRGTGDALAYALTNAGDAAYSAANNNAAQDLFNRVWNNLPGRYDVKQNVYFSSATPLYSYLNGTIYSELQNDTADWTHGQLPLWIIAQSGPMQQINSIFTNTLGQNAANLPEPFQRMGEEVLHGWFAESYMMNWNNRNNKNIP